MGMWCVTPPILLYSSAHLAYGSATDLNFHDKVASIRVDPPRVPDLRSLHTLGRNRSWGERYSALLPGSRSLSMVWSPNWLALTFEFGERDSLDGLVQPRIPADQLGYISHDD